MKVAESYPNHPLHHLLRFRRCRCGLYMSLSSSSSQSSSFSSWHLWDHRGWTIKVRFPPFQAGLQVTSIAPNLWILNEHAEDLGDAHTLRKWEKWTTGIEGEFKTDQDFIEHPGQIMWCFPSQLPTRKVPTLVP